ncbi:uncharacterized protein LOC141559126 isoform X1 [Sminthopsis crassicaudata]|uniref:uncharacterized protein LOC141559126 isoform X1 n=1 Tax=Sminthopsis crassicaudata TaxID=9301 RepID=UPI003D69D74D
MWIWDSYQAHLAVHPKPMATLEGAAGAPRCPPPPAAPCHSPSQWGPPSRPAFREQADDRSVPSQEGRSELMITQKADHKILQIHLSCEKREQRLGLSHRGQTAAQGSVSSGGALTWISSRRSSCSLGPHSLLQSPGSSGQRPRPGRRHQGSEARRVLFRRRHKAFPRPWVQEKAGLGGGGDGPGFSNTSGASWPRHLTRGPGPGPSLLDFSTCPRKSIIGITSFSPRNPSCSPSPATRSSKIP